MHDHCGTVVYCCFALTTRERCRVSRGFRVQGEAAKNSSLNPNKPHHTRALQEGQVGGWEVVGAVYSAKGWQGHNKSDTAVAGGVAAAECGHCIS